MSARRDIGPCGHVCTFILPAFALCTLKHCDTKPGGCLKCGSKRSYAFQSPFTPPDTVACHDCGAVRWPGVG